MAQITVYKTEEMQTRHHDVLSNIYEDFLQKAKEDYRFYCEPISLNKLMDCIRKKLLRGLILYENEAIKAFMLYTTMIGASISINIVHMIDYENYEERISFMLREFFKILNNSKIKRTIEFPLLGVQEKYENVLKNYGFNFIDNSIYVLSESEFNNFTEDNKIAFGENIQVRSWDNFYFDSASILIHTCFKNSNDAQYDLRYRTIVGTRDILTKIVKNDYGYFLPQQSTILVNEKNKVVGTCLVNLVTQSVAVISNLALDNSLRGKKYGKKLVNITLKKLIDTSFNDQIKLDEINVTSGTNNEITYNTYTSNGFSLLYSYKQAYYNIIENHI